MSTLDPTLLQLSIFIPFLMGVILILWNSNTRLVPKTLAFVGFAFPCLIALWLVFQYAGATKVAQGYAFYSDIDTGLSTLGISLKLGLNGIALPLYLLAGIVGLASGVYAIYANTDRLPLYLGLLLVMQAGLMGTFASIDIFFFYFFHEFALIPTFIMIGIWGGRGRRIAAMELTIYLTLGAMLSLIGLIALYGQSGLNSFDLMSLKNHLASQPIGESVQKNIFGLLLFGFGILVSLFPFHTWAPRGYGAAPTSAAMLHAGVLKKFGLYGLIQIAAPLLPEGAGHWTTLLAWLALGNILIIGLVTMAQKDLKQLVGYSSVMHMGYCFLGVACLSTMGAGAAILMMFAHGLSVALLFLLTTAVYHRTGTYDMREIGGLCKDAPVLCGFFVAAMMANIGLPGFANFWGEIGIFLSVWEFQPWMVFVAVSGIVISAIYGLRAIANIFFGARTDEFAKKGPVSDITRSERLPALILAAALVIVGFWPGSITQFLDKQFQHESSQQVAILSQNINK